MKLKSSLQKTGSESFRNHKNRCRSHAIAAVFAVFKRKCPQKGYVGHSYVNVSITSGSLMRLNKEAGTAV